MRYREQHPTFIPPMLLTSGAELYSDDRRVCRVYQMSIGDREWKLWREGDPFPQRFTGTISEDGEKISGRWERAADGVTYTTDFYLTYTGAR